MTAYRYTLTRDVLGLGGDGRVLFVMLNPSTADDERDDATIRRCRGFAREWRKTSLEVVNLFAMRSTDPLGLLAVERAAAVGGLENNRNILAACLRADRIVCAWGAHARLGELLTSRAAAVVDLIRAEGHGLHVLGLAKNGQPLHPLRLRADLQPKVWEP